MILGPDRKSKTLQLRLTPSQLDAIRAAAKVAGQTASQFGAEAVLKVVLGGGRDRFEEIIGAIEKFEAKFDRATELSLDGKLTASKFRDLRKGAGV